MRFKKHLLGWLAATLLFSSQTQARRWFSPPKALPSSIFFPQ